MPITSLTTTTIVSSLMATGTVDADLFKNKWLMRAESATSADRVRLCTDFTASTGTFAHAGANYSDTTATSEELEIHEFDPYMLDEGINITLGRLKRRYEVEIPAWKSYRNWMGNFSWIEPKNVRKVELVYSPQLTRNRYFQNFGAYDSSDVLTPDGWTLSGASATMARSSTQTWKGGFSLAITRSGTDCTLDQTVGLLDDGVSADTLQSQTVGMFGRFWSAVASQVRLRVTDGVTTTNSSYHTGGSGWEELSLTHTLSATATTLTFSVRVEGSNTVAYAGEAAGFWSTITDTLRRDNYPRTIEWDRRFDTTGATLALDLPVRGFGSYWRVSALRGYPQLDWTRLAAGSDETSIIDAPLVPMVAGTLAHFYGRLAGRSGEDTTRYKDLALQWGRKFDQLALAHISEPGAYGQPLRGRTLAYSARRP